MAKQLTEEQKRVRNGLLEITTRRFWQDYTEEGGKKLPLEMPPSGQGRLDVIYAQKLEKEFNDNILNSMINIFQMQQALLKENKELFDVLWETNAPPPQAEPQQN